MTLEDLSPSGSIGDAIGNEQDEVKCNYNYNRQYSSLGEIGKSKDFDVLKVKTVIHEMFILN